MSESEQPHSMQGKIQPDRNRGHVGEKEMRARIPSNYGFDDTMIAGMMRPYISSSFADFIEVLPFFFIATSDEEGHCDCSFRGREFDASGNPLPILRVTGQQALVFPDFSGNGFYNSLGNILVNPHIGMLFMNFEYRQRVRINGIATVIEASKEITDIWPMAQAAVSVQVEQAYGNCRARIPKMTLR